MSRAKTHPRLFSTYYTDTTGSGRRSTPSSSSGDRSSTNGGVTVVVCSSSSKWEFMPALNVATVVYGGKPRESHSAWALQNLTFPFARGS